MPLRVAFARCAHPCRQDAIASVVPYMWCIYICLPGRGAWCLPPFALGLRPAPPVLVRRCVCRAPLRAGPSAARASESRAGGRLQQGGCVYPCPVARRAARCPVARRVALCLARRCARGCSLARRGARCSNLCARREALCVGSARGAMPLCGAALCALPLRSALCAPLFTGAA